MNVGDVITILRIRFPGETIRTPARVISIHHETIGVQCLQGAFDEDGNDKMAVHLRDKGRTWE
jgi:hypothetical protein